MLAATLTFGLTEFDKATLDIEHKQLPYATMLALNDTAFGARKAIAQQMVKVFDRPTPYARRGVVYERATKANLESRVVLHGSNWGGGLPPALFLGPQIEGGKRSHKAFEKQLHALGLLPDGHVAVPAERTKLDRYGNIGQGQLNRMMSGLKIDYRSAGSNRVASTKKGKARRARGSRGGFYFVPKEGSHLAPGVWLELGFPMRAIYPVLLFVKSPTYQVRLQFAPVIQKYYDENFDRYFARGWSRAIKTAR